LAACGSDVRHLLEEAEARWRSGQYEEAIRLNTLLYQKDPAGRLAPRALLNLGNIYYLNLRRLDPAIETYQRIVGEFPATSEALKAHEQLAEIYVHEIGDLTQAIAEYETLLRSNRLDHPQEIQFRLANAYFKGDDYDRALRELRRLQEAGVGGHLADQVSLRIGNIYQIEKKYEDAVAAYGKVSTSPCMECRRRALLSLMESYEALFDFDRAIEAVGQLDRVPQNEGRIEQEVRRLTEKRKRVLSADPSIWTP
jgi:tetratricopeptide (TPR) repeat protein